MTTLLIVLLLVGAAFNVLVWPSFFRRVSRDPRARTEDGRPTRFLLVHAALVGIALLIAAASAVAAFIAMGS
ncbi:SCO4848 family membrane protein [Microbacterium dauci]|uniref:Integral membrane protein n=1 Tax=Microbacterium dauci TaxID=3048008 RepID=A0ABT6ZBJ5_9MICO|nr:hypothetical protein [Microbacterium sp. LX3-4]MDJ1113525.1 hypothetical protein [Microbacterium sp. LX3-4]